MRPRARPDKPPAILWHTTELWDFGLPVTIEVPEAEPRCRPIRRARDVGRSGTTLWRVSAPT